MCHANAGPLLGVDATVVDEAADVLEVIVGEVGCLCGRDPLVGSKSSVIAFALCLVLQRLHCRFLLTRQNGL